MQMINNNTIINNASILTNNTTTAGINNINIETYLAPLRVVLQSYRKYGNSEIAKYFDLSVNNLADKFNLKPSEIKERLMINN